MDLGGNSRGGIDLVQEPTAILLGKDPREAPRLVLEGLHVHNLNKEDVAWLSALDLEGPAEVVYLGEIHILDVVG